jgi:hypothetical protein
MASAVGIAEGNFGQVRNEISTPQPFRDGRTEFPLQYDRYTVYCFQFCLDILGVCHAFPYSRLDEQQVRSNEARPSSGSSVIIRDDMGPKKRDVLMVRCPTCGAKPGEKCELATGQPRINPHRERRWVAADE